MEQSIEEKRWEAVCRRDVSLTGVFVYGVSTTNIYCRPGCASRRPLRTNVEFFSTPDAARSSGYRPCRRCRPEDAHVADPMLNAVIEVCRSLERPQAGRSVAELAADLGYSERHLRRRFVEVIGVTAGAYARAQRERRVRDALLAGDSVTGSIVASGYGSFSAFYDKGAPTLGMAPGRYRDGGLGERISFTTIATPLGVILVGCTSRGVCAVRLGEHVDALESELVAEFPQAHIERDDESLLEVALVVAGAVRGERDATHLPLDVAGTAFQIRVWAALRSIPLGETRTYSDIAHAIGASSSIRAVASACAANGAALTIPCHRVIRRDGTLGGYRWGVDAKVEILRNESAAASKSVKNSGIR